MGTKTTLWILAGLLLVCLLAGIIAYPLLPEQVASHWNAQGQADGYSGRVSSLILLPAITIGMALLMLVIPFIDPLRANIEQFRGTYNAFVVVFAVYMVYVHALTLLINLGYPVGINRGLAPAMGVLFIASGFMMGQARRNYFIGIRTPWTLANDVVWDKTHRLGKWLFIAAGILCAGGVIWPNLLIGFILIPVLLAVLVAVIYSYLLYRQEVWSKHP